MWFALPEGETRIEGIVRYAYKGKGIGVEFAKKGRRRSRALAGASAPLEPLIRRLHSPEAASRARSYFIVLFRNATVRVHASAAASGR